MKELAQNYIEHLSTLKGPEYDFCLDQLRVIGQAEIEDSTKVEKLTPSYLSYSKQIQKWVEPNWFRKLFPVDEMIIRFRLESGIRIVKSSISDFRKNKEQIVKHIARISLMIEVATSLLNEVYIIMPLNKEVRYILQSRKEIMLEHISVLILAQTSIELHIQNALAVITMAEKVLNTYSLAKKIQNEKYHDIQSIKWLDKDIL